MAGYFHSREDAEKNIREWGKSVVFFARILTSYGEERWLVDFWRKDYEGDIRILEGLTAGIPSIVGK